MPVPHTLSGPGAASDKFDLFYAEHQENLFRYVRSRLDIKESAEDVCSTTWLVLMEHPDILEKHPNPIGWLYRTANYRIKRFYAGTGGERDYPSLDDPAMSQYAIDRRDVWSEQDVRDGLLMASIESLPPAQHKAVVKAYYFADKKEPLTDAERAALSRAYKALRGSLPPWVMDDG